MNSFKLTFFVKVEKTDSNIYNNNLLLHYLSCSHYHCDHLEENPFIHPAKGVPVKDKFKTI